MPGIFISYRREDSAGWAGRLFDQLKANFGSAHVFRDIDTIDAGVDFVKVIDEAVSSSTAMIALIGPQWLTVKDAQQRRRLDCPEDFIRMEIATALQCNITVIPVLVGGAAMPASDDLPEPLKMLARRQAHELSDKRWDFDADQLIKTLSKLTGPGNPAPARAGGPPPILAIPKFSAKAAVSFIFAGISFLVLFSEELDVDGIIGGLFLALLGGGLAGWAVYDAQRGKVKGRIPAIVCAVICGLMMLDYIAQWAELGSESEPAPSVQDPVYYQ